MPKCPLCHYAISDLQRALDGILESYNTSEPPPDQNPVDVKARFKVLSFNHLDTQDMDFIVDLLLDLRWTDRRLNHADIKVDNHCM